METTNARVGTLDADLRAPFFSPKRRQSLERNIPSVKSGSKLRCKAKLSSMSTDEGLKFVEEKFLTLQRNDLQCGNAPRFTIFPRQETRNVLHLVNSSSILLNFSSLNKKEKQRKVKL